MSVVEQDKTKTELDAVGLEQGNVLSSQDVPSVRSGDVLLEAAAAESPLQPREQVDLLDYFLTNDGLPGERDPHRLEFQVGTVKNVWMVQPITFEAWQQGAELATNEEKGTTDGFIWASYNVARAVVTPKLAPALKRLRDEAAASVDGKLPGPDGSSRVDPPTDIAGVLRRMFRKQSGTLLDMSGEILTLSKLAQGDKGARLLADDVESGKD